MKLGAVNVAAITPHRKDSNHTDLSATFELVDYLCAAGVHGIALLGSTGEFLHLTLDDRAHLVRMAVKRCRVPIIAGVSYSTMEGAVALAEAASDAGAAAILLMPPYFYRYEQSEVREFYLRFAERLHSSPPILLYNIPFFTSEISCSTAAELLATGRFAGIKDSSGDFDYFAKLKSLRETKPFTLLVGNDVIFSRARSEGADGVVSGVACAVPELMLALEAAIGRGAAQKVDRLEMRLQEFVAWIDRFPTPVGVREATGLRGIKVGPMATPLSPQKQKSLQDFREWFPAWLKTVKKESIED